jgi:hypothetical protein
MKHQGLFNVSTYGLNMNCVQNQSGYRSMTKYEHPDLASPNIDERVLLNE